MKARASDVVVVGGGVIGLSVAWHLGREGVGVTVLQGNPTPSRDHGQATAAAAGMLAPLAETPNPGPLVELGLTSLRAYPGFVAALREATGIDVEIAGPGMLRLAGSEAEEAELRAAFAWQRGLGMALEWLDPDALRRLEPQLAPHLAGILSLEEKHVNPWPLAGALLTAASGVDRRVVQGSEVVGFETRENEVLSVRTGTGHFPCREVVIAAGAWTAAVGERLGVSLPVFPVRGQTLELSSDPVPVRHTIYTHRGYLVPREGALVVGATQEEVGFVARNTVNGMIQLLEGARGLVPGLGEASFRAVSVGFRPATSDGLPLIGRLPGWKNVHVASGHFRNGILLAPVTGELVAAGITTGTYPTLAAPFRPDRFAGRS